MDGKNSSWATNLSARKVQPFSTYHLDPSGYLTSIDGKWSIEIDDYHLVMTNIAMV